MDEKINETTFKIDKIIPEKIVSVEYTLDFLLAQKERIQAQKDSDNEKRDAELAEIDELLQRAKTLGIKQAVDVTLVESTSEVIDNP